MKSPAYVVTAEGSINRETITVIMRAENVSDAMEEAKRIIRALTPAGYSVFTIYETRDTNDLYVMTLHSNTKIEVF